MHIRRLTPTDANLFQTLRLNALQEVPFAFGSSYDEEKDFSIATIEGRLAVKPDRGVFGAFEDQALVGMVALGRENMKKLAHKGLIWGMYVIPAARGKGVGSALLLEALALARSVPEIRQINLCVDANNGDAIRLYESVGFKAFGREADALCIDGELHDDIHMCLRVADFR
jgi:ribosomal protein S18 acetylase RimI-like enzyme